MSSLTHSIKVDKELLLFCKSKLIDEQKKGSSLKSINDYLKSELGI